MDKRIYGLSFLLVFMPLFLFAQGALLLVGGGREDKNTWSDAPYGWFVREADSGKIVNIDVDEASSWYPGYFEWLGADESSEHIRIATRTAADDSVIFRKLVEANGIFMEGGDQYDYVQTWKGTLVEEAIHQVFNRGGAIGGTSAGLAVLGAVTFDARYGSAYPEQCSYNPYDSRIHFEDDFLNILPGVLTDSHFHSRGRLGRLIPMLARRIQDFGEPDIIGIGVADKSALCIEADWTATAYGEGSVTLLYKSDDSELICEPGRPLTFTNLHYDQLTPGAVYDLKTRQLLDPGPYLTTVNDQNHTGVYPDTLIPGGDENSAAFGVVRINRLTSGDLNAWNGRLTQSPGDSIVPGVIIIPNLYSSSDFYENRFVGGMWGAATNPGTNVVYLDTLTLAEMNTAGLMLFQNFALVLDTKDVTYSGVNGTRMTNYCGLIGARIHSLGPGDAFDFQNIQPVVTHIHSEKKKINKGFGLADNYPNPFNSVTTIRYLVEGDGPVYRDMTMFIYDYLGQKIAVVNAGPQPPGYHEIRWDASAFGSGIYYYRIEIGGTVTTGRCVYIR